MDKEVILSEIKKTGKQMTEDLHITGQATKIINNMDNFPYEHFKVWWVKHYANVSGGHLHHYFTAKDGIVETK